MFRKIRLVLAGLAFAVVALYLAACAIARLAYRRLVYPIPADPAPTLPADAIWLAAQSEDGATVRAAFFPPPTRSSSSDPPRTVIIFHGNGETIANGAGLAEDLRARGLGAVLFEYRGYGVSAAAGPPSERGIDDDAESMLSALAMRGIDSSRIALVGFSLGTGVAAEMARRGRGASLTLVSPYTSMVAMGERIVPWLPVAWLLPDKFDTLSKAREIRIPTLVVHGDADEIVPFAMGRRVASAIAGATLVSIAGGHHGDLFGVTGGRLVDQIAAQAKK